MFEFYSFLAVNLWLIDQVLHLTTDYSKSVPSLISATLRDHFDKGTTFCFVCQTLWMSFLASHLIQRFPVQIHFYYSTFNSVEL